MSTSPITSIPDTAALTEKLLFEILQYAGGTPGGGTANAANQVIGNAFLEDILAKLDDLNQEATQEEIKDFLTTYDFAKDATLQLLLDALAGLGREATLDAILTFLTAYDFAKDATLQLILSAIENLGTEETLQLILDKLPASPASEETLTSVETVLGLIKDAVSTETTLQEVKTELSAIKDALAREETLELVKGELVAIKDGMSREETLVNVRDDVSAVKASTQKTADAVVEDEKLATNEKLIRVENVLSDIREFVSEILTRPDVANLSVHAVRSTSAIALQDDILSFYSGLGSTAKVYFTSCYFDGALHIAIIQYYSPPPPEE
jgi:hypothetical protein